MPPRVSVIIPVYNNARFIGEAIESVLLQKGISREILVIDDGSTDETRQVLMKFDNRIRYVYQENRGVSAARNRGIHLARGEFVVFLDADDVFLPGKLREQVRCFDRHEKLGIVHSGWDVVDENKTLIEECRPWDEAPNLDLKTWLLWKPIFPGALMFRRPWLERVGGFDPQFTQAEDVDLVLRLSLAGCKATWLKLPTVTYRQHGGNISNDARAQARGIHDVLEKFFADDRLPRSIRKLKRRIFHYTSLWAAWYLYRWGQHDEAVEYLRLTFQHNYRDDKVKVIHWFAQFVKLSMRAGCSRGELKQIVPLFRHAANLSELDWSELEQALLWWLEVWLFYHEQRYDEAAQRLASYAHWDSRRLFHAQYCLLVSPLPIGVSEVNRFWLDSTRRGFVPPSRRFDLALLHLSLFAQHVWARRWWQALHGLAWAVRTGFHPKAAYVWYRFFRSAITYYLLQPRGA